MDLFCSLFFFFMVIKKKKLIIYKSNKSWENKISRGKPKITLKLIVKDGMLIKNVTMSIVCFEYDKMTEKNICSRLD